MCGIIPHIEKVASYTTGIRSYLGGFAELYSHYFLD
jgi:hypothetical protein